MRDKGWLLVMPLSLEDALHKMQQLNHLGFSSITDPGIQPEPYAVDPQQAFLAAQKVPARQKADKEPDTESPVMKTASSGFARKVRRRR